jgi:hypothetical protein
MKGTYHVLIVYDDIEPELVGPFDTFQARDERSKELKRQHGNEHGIFTLDVDAKGTPSVGAYPAGFFMGDEETEV